MLITVRAGRADVAPNPARPATGRHLSVKVDRYLDRVYSPDRVFHPLRRAGAKGDGPIRSTSSDLAFLFVDVDAKMISVLCQRWVLPAGELRNDA